MNDPRVIVALDFAHAEEALDLAQRLRPELCRLKIGKELYTAAGPALAEKLTRGGYDIFLDLKYHDIPSTVAGACRAAADLGVWMVNVHALGGRAMMLAARDALAAHSKRPLLLAVTLLTSMGEGDLADLGIGGTPHDAVLRLGRLARSCGLDGVVCSAHEAAAVRQQCGTGFCLVTPGIRPATIGQDDQQRIATPRQAISNGADYLVIGRPVTRATDPLAALQRINDEIIG